MFSGFLALAANELDVARIRTPESMAHCQRTCDRYITADIEDVNEISSLVVCTLRTEFHDFLDVAFAELKLGDSFRGQYFAPYSAQYLMAHLLMPGAQDTIRREGIVTVSNPVSGAAGMLIAYAEYLLEADINPPWHMFGNCADIDPVTVDIASIQLSLLDIAAEVVTSNVLTI